MKKSLAATLVLATAAFAWYSLPPLPPPEGVLTYGVVLSLDARAGNVTIRHAPLKNLGMPAMTMDFQVAEPALLATIRRGDEVRFHADVVGDTLTVTRIEPAN
jgi:Cu(I)/Ag(I) efflux system periplasmic protein CusF